jgi:hypothetical protein
MAWIAWGLGLIPIGFVFIYISLWAGCRICRVPVGSATRLARASVLPLILVALYYCWFAMAWDALRFLSSGLEIFILPAPVFFALLFGAPWFLRPAEGGGWGRVWGAAAIGGIVLVWLVIATVYITYSVSSTVVSSTNNKQNTAQTANIFQQYGLPFPSGAKSSTPPFSATPELLDIARTNPDYKGLPGDWTKRWPSNHMLSFMSPEAPASLQDAIARGLSQAGFSVSRGGPKPEDAGSQGYVAGAKPGVFVVYECSNCSIEGCKSICYVQVWLDFAKEMEAAGKAELGGGKKANSK